MAYAFPQLEKVRLLDAKVLLGQSVVMCPHEQDAWDKNQAQSKSSV